MARKQYSYSKISTFTGCRWKFYLNYIKKYKIQRNDGQDALAKKGLAVHEAAEHYKPGMSKDDLLKIIQENATKYGIPLEAYDFSEAANRVHWFMADFVKTYQDEGLTLTNEATASGKLAEIPFIGYLDIFLDSPDKMVIADFKTGKTANAGSYKTQLFLYAYIMGLDKGWDFNDIAEKVKLYVYFPLANTANKYKDDAHARCLASLKEIVFTASDIATTIGSIERNIEQIEDFNWEVVDHNRDAQPSFACNWCQFAGIPSDLNPNCYCNKSRQKLNKTCPRGIKISN